MGGQRECGINCLIITEFLFDVMKDSSPSFYCDIILKVWEIDSGDGCTTL